MAERALENYTIVVLRDFYRHLKGETQIVSEESVLRGMLRIERKKFREC
jgi:hypothetical protein